MPEKSDQPQPDQPDPTLITELGHLAYLGWWMLKFYSRRVLITKFVPKLLLALSVIELSGAILHVIHPLLHQTPLEARFEKLFRIVESPRVDIALAVVFFIAALLLVTHHHRLDHRIHRLRALIARMVVLLGQDRFRNSNRAGLLEKQAVIREALDLFIEAVRYENRYARFHASVLVRKNGQFHIFAQNTGGRFDLATKVYGDREKSVAGATACEEPDTLVYVPRASCLHGVKIKAEKAQRSHMPHDAPVEYMTESIKTTRPIWNIFQSLGPENDATITSLLCIRIADPHAHPGNASDSGLAVLSLSCPDHDALGDLEFSAIKFFASLISLNLNCDFSSFLDTNLP